MGELLTPRLRLVAATPDIARAEFEKSSRFGSAACRDSSRLATPLFLSLGRVVPNAYLVARDLERCIADEQHLGRILDYAVRLLLWIVERKTDGWGTKFEPPFSQ